MKTEIVISITAIFISLSAFGVALWQGYVARKHNRLSVRPMLHFDLGIKGNDYLLTMKNTGVGPAIIRSWSVSVDGKSMGTNSLQVATNLFEEFEVGHLGGAMYLPGEGQAMSASDSFQIMKIENIIDDNEAYQRIMNNFSLCNIVFKYESIYSEEFELSGPDVA